MIGDVLFQEMIYKVNRDSLLLVFRFESLGPGHWKGQQRPKFYKNSLKGMSIKQNFCLYRCTKIVYEVTMKSCGQLFFEMIYCTWQNYNLKENVKIILMVGLSLVIGKVPERD